MLLGKSATPTGVAASDWNWQVFHRIQGLEGFVCRAGPFPPVPKEYGKLPGCACLA